MSDAASSGFTVPKSDASSAAAANLRALSAVLLAILTITSFVANTSALATIAASRRLRTTPFYVFVLNLLVLNVVNTCVNMFLSLLYVAQGTWAAGAFVCALNAAVVTLVMMQSLAGRRPVLS